MGVSKKVSNSHKFSWTVPVTFSGIKTVLTVINFIIKLVQWSKVLFISKDQDKIQEDGKYYFALWENESEEKSIKDQKNTLASEYFDVHSQSLIPSVEHHLWIYFSYG